ncbi:hypothetical protein GCM10009745_00750 [Kribbella yunnanensis]|uniref:Uncharacterized protein n=1 Tax=Kribbella yunnanensis TaxID=190194 RepID=A0ABP4S324_9ACTN
MLRPALPPHPIHMRIEMPQVMPPQPLLLPIRRNPPRQNPNRIRKKHQPSIPTTHPGERGGVGRAATPPRKAWWGRMGRRLTPESGGWAATPPTPPSVVWSGGDGVRLNRG